MGVCITFPDALWYTALAQEVPEHTISRVSSSDFLGSFTLRPVGYLVAAPRVAIGAQRALLFIAVLFGIVTIGSLAVPGVWSLSRTPPECDDQLAGAP